MLARQALSALDWEEEEEGEEEEERERSRDKERAARKQEQQHVGGGVARRGRRRRAPAVPSGGETGGTGGTVVGAKDKGPAGSGGLRRAGDPPASHLAARLRGAPGRQQRQPASGERASYIS